MTAVSDGNWVISLTTGEIVLLAGGAPVPTGYVACNGATYDGTNVLYQQLWKKCGTRYGGTGVSSFHVPNLTDGFDGANLNAGTVPFSALVGYPNDATKQPTGDGTWDTIGVLPTVLLVNFPPASPVDGQSIWLILPSTYDPVGGKTVRWLATYNATDSVWNISGTPLLVIQDTEESLTGNGAYQDTVNACSLTIPRAGDYLIDNGGSLVAANTSFAYVISYTNGPTASLDADSVGDITRNGISVQNGVRRREKTVATAANVIKQQTKGTGAGLYIVKQRWISATPVRIT